MHISLPVGTKGALTVHEFFTTLYLLDVYIVQQKVPDTLPGGIFPPGVHQCYQAAGIGVPLSLQPSTVAHVPLADQNPIENLALEAESANSVRHPNGPPYQTQQDVRLSTDTCSGLPYIFRGAAKDSSKWRKPLFASRGHLTMTTLRSPVLKFVLTVAMQWRM